MLIDSGKLTLTEVKTMATLDDVLMITATAEMNADMQEVARRAAESKRESNQ